MSKASQLFRGSLWTYASQLVTILVQFGYAASTSRLLGATAFGSYAVALTAIGLFTLVASGGIGQAAATLHEVDKRHVSALATYALVLGAVLGAAAAVLSHPVAELWGVASATSTIRLLAVSALMAPLMALTSGLIRRLGAFRFLALLTLASNCFGMALGLWAVYVFRTPVSLAVSAVVSTCLIVLGSIWRVRTLFGKLTWRFWVHDGVRFSRRIVLVNVFQYGLANTTRFVAAQTLGASALGQWNRAEVMGSLPFQQIQTAIVPVLYPEFRHDRGGTSRAFRVWTDVLGVLAWVMLPLGAIGATVLPLLVPLILGPTWGMAGLYAIPLAIAGCVQPMTYVLLAGLEATRHFRAIWLANWIVLSTQVVLASLVAITHFLMPALLGLLATNLTLHAIHLRTAGAAGLLSLRRLLKHYLAAAALAVAAAAWIATALYLLPATSGDFRLAVAALLAATVAGAIAGTARKWFDLPPVRLVHGLALASSRLAPTAGRTDPTS